VDKLWYIALQRYIWVWNITQQSNIPQFVLVINDTSLYILSLRSSYTMLCFQGPVWKTDFASASAAFFSVQKLHVNSYQAGQSASHRVFIISSIIAGGTEWIAFELVGSCATERTRLYLQPPQLLDARGSDILNHPFSAWNRILIYADSASRTDRRTRSLDKFNS